MTALSPLMTAPDRQAVLVTGATGQIGRALIERFLGHGDPIVALCHRRRIPENASGLTWVNGDLAANQVDFGGQSLDRAVHATGLWLLPRHLPALRSLGVKRLVAFGSTSIFGKTGTRARFEQQQIAQIIEAENEVAELCAKLEIAWTILRPTLTYGVGVDKNISTAARFIDRFGFYPISGAAGGLRQPVHAEDLADAAFQVLAAPETAGNSYDLGGAETLAYREMIGRIFDVLGRPRRLISIPFLRQLAGAWGRLSGNRTLTADVVTRMNRDLVFDHGAARQAFGYAPRAFLANGRDDLGL